MPKHTDQTTTDALSWDERHELIESTLLAHLERILGGSAVYDDAVVSWFVTTGDGTGPSIDVTDIASDINVALGPTSAMVASREADASPTSENGTSTTVSDNA